MDEYINTIYSVTLNTDQGLHLNWKAEVKGQETIEKKEQTSGMVYLVASPLEDNERISLLSYQLKGRLRA